MRFAAIGLALLLTGCLGIPRNDGAPEIAPAPSKLVFSGEESCGALQGMFDEAHRDERWNLSRVTAMWPASDVSAVITLGLSDLEIDAHMRAVASARGDKAALAQEMLRRECPTVSRTLPPGFKAETAN